MKFFEFLDDHSYLIPAVCICSLFIFMTFIVAVQVQANPSANETYSDGYVAIVDTAEDHIVYSHSGKFRVRYDPNDIVCIETSGEQHEFKLGDHTHIVIEEVCVMEEGDENADPK